MNSKNSIDTQDLKQTWQSMWAKFSQATEQFKQLVESETDIDLQEKRKVYLIIAKFLHDNFQKPLPVSLRATHILCNEINPRLLSDGVLDDEAQQLVESAKEVILIIKVLYEPGANSSYNRQIEIIWFKNDQLTAVKVEEEVSWDALPPDVREKHLCSGATRQIFTLYQMEA